MLTAVWFEGSILSDGDSGTGEVGSSIGAGDRRTAGLGEKRHD